MSALDIQIGGSHYRNKGIQPIKLIVALNLNFIEGNITSAILKNVLLSYYRYERRYSHVVTEFFDADVVVSNQKITIECEVKISLLKY